VTVREYRKVLSIICYLKYVRLKSSTVIVFIYIINKKLLAYLLYNGLASYFYKYYSYVYNKMYSNIPEVCLS